MFVELQKIQHALRPEDDAAMQVVNTDRLCELLNSITYLCCEQADDDGANYALGADDEGSMDATGTGTASSKDAASAASGAALVAGASAAGGSGSSTGSAATVPASEGKQSAAAAAAGHAIAPVPTQAARDSAAALMEKCCLPTSPHAMRMELFENERRAPVLGWGKRLLPGDCGLFSNETGTVSFSVSSMEQLVDVPPLPGHVWEEFSSWELDKEYAACDGKGWSYAISWWVLSLHLRQGNSCDVEGMSFVRRRKWYRDMRKVNGAEAAAVAFSTALVAPMGMPEQRPPSSPAPPPPITAVSAAPVMPPSIPPPPPDTPPPPAPSDSGSRVAVPESPPPPELPPEARDVLVAHALHAVTLAEEMMAHEDPAHMRCWFHAAVVYFEVLRGFGDLAPDLDLQRRRVHRLARLCSHLHENCVMEHDAGGRRVGDIYILHAETVLGQGSYGTVCLATHRRTQHRFACKVLNINRIGPQYIDKLHAEIDAMRQLDHPHIVRLREVFYGKRKIYLIMDLCTGGELFELVNTPGEHRSEAHAARFLVQMLSAVKYMHAQGIVHRDLKLENWLFEQPPCHDAASASAADGSAGSQPAGPGALRQGATLKLIDFGLSKHFRSHEHIVGAVGSMYYVAPEVLRGSYTAQCDLWSLGVIAYMLLSGAPPFWGRDDCEIRHRILAGRWQFTPRFFGHVSDLAKDFISSLLQHDPARRLDASAALAHPWLRVPAAHLPRGEQASLLAQLRSFSAAGMMQKVILEVVAFHLTPTQARDSTLNVCSAALLSALHVRPPPPLPHPPHGTTSIDRLFFNRDSETSSAPPPPPQTSPPNPLEANAVAPLTSRAPPFASRCPHCSPSLPHIATDRGSARAL